jgi:hypothetical protein
VKPRNMLTWMLWSAAASLSPPGHGQVLDLTFTDPSQFVRQGTVAVEKTPSGAGYHSGSNTFARPSPRR